jgi:hypothetical protein
LTTASRVGRKRVAFASERGPLDEWPSGLVPERHEAGPKARLAVQLGVERRFDYQVFEVGQPAPLTVSTHVRVTMPVAARVMVNVLVDFDVEVMA